MAVIGLMVATALAVGNPVAAVGAVLFAASDTMIASDRFSAACPGSGVWIMATYHLGQAGPRGVAPALKRRSQRDPVMRAWPC